MKKAFTTLVTVALVLGCAVVAGAAVSANSPASIPPVSVGPKTLTGDGSPPTAYEFFLQAGSSWKGDIGGIVAGPTYSLGILGIDVTGVTGPAGRGIYFNLQDAESGSTFKHLGIQVILQDAGAGGKALLQCYQSFTSEGLSSHGFNAGVLTEGDFDLRFDFTKASSGAGWTVTPYYRLSGGCWNQFFDGPFVGSVPFDFLGAKLATVFDHGADGTVSFANYYLSGSPSSVCVTTTTGTGTASLAPSNGEIRYLTPVTAPGMTSVTLPHGMFSFEICCIPPGGTVTLTVTLPDPVPLGTRWWKYQNGSWYWLPIGSDDGDNIITVTLQDGGQGDEDAVLGQITDDGGPGTGAVGWETYPTNKVRVLLPWIVLGAAIIAGASLLVIKRRRAQS